jgi:steroid delta-isomerase-like uncharacterized protein
MPAGIDNFPVRNCECTKALVNPIICFQWMVEKRRSAMATTMTDLEQHTKELYAAINAHDLEKFLSLHTDDIVVNMADGLVLQGQDAVRSYFQGVFTAFSEVKADLASVITSGNRQCEEYVISGKHTGDYMGIPATGKSFSYPIVAIREFREGKTSKVSSYSDSAALIRQLGISIPQK